MNLTHPDTKAKVDARPEHVDMYLSQGWEKTPAKPKPKPEPTPSSD